MNTLAVIDSPIIPAGKIITAIEWTPDVLYLTIDGQRLKFIPEGDCCSHSYIAAFDGSEDIIGKPLVRVEAADMPDNIRNATFEGQEYECLSFYGYRFHTIDASALLEFRNESNGYYGGWLKFRGVEPFDPSKPVIDAEVVK